MQLNCDSIIGYKYGMLLVVEYTHTAQKNRFYRCICDCGNTCIKRGTYIKRNRVHSCGCLLKKTNTKHGYASGDRKNIIPEYSIWLAMKQRCYYSKSVQYHNYGGRGIRVCQEWLGDNGFLSFITYMGKRPSPKHSLDRFPNKNGDYCPGNVRWATSVEQNRNLRSNKWLTYNGEQIIQKDFCKLVGLGIKQLNNYIKTMNPDQIVEYLKKREPHSERIKNIIGMKRFQLTVISFEGVNNRKSSIWKCLCSCGNSIMLPYGQVIRNKSCGCLSRKNI